MAKVKITGHASGSGVITVTAPNTSTDRTITLPDATATIATTTDVAARLPSITDGGNATAITIDSSERVGIQQTSPVSMLSLGQDSGSGDSAACSGITFKTSNNDDMFQLSTVGGGNAAARGLKFSVDGTEKFRMTGDGKGRSLFTAAAWFSAEGAGTPSFHQSHNCSSISSMGSAGYYQVNWDTDFANSNYAIVNNAHRDAYEDQSIYNLAYSTGNVRYVYVQDSTGAQDISDFSSLAFGA